MTKVPAPLTDDLYLRLLWFVDLLIPLVQQAVTSPDRNTVELQFLPRYSMLWDTVLGNLQRFNPALRKDVHTLYARDSLERIDSLDNLWLPSSQLQVEESDTSESFFDDDFVEYLMQFLPCSQDVPSQRVRRILWKRNQAENMGVIGGQDLSYDLRCNIDELGDSVTGDMTPPGVSDIQSLDNSRFMTSLPELSCHSSATGLRNGGLNAVLETTTMTDLSAKVGAGDVMRQPQNVEMTSAITEVHPSLGRSETEYTLVSSDSESMPAESGSLDR